MSYTKLLIISITLPVLAPAIKLDDISILTDSKQTVSSKSTTSLNNNTSLKINPNTPSNLSSKQLNPTVRNIHYNTIDIIKIFIYKNRILTTVLSIVLFAAILLPILNATLGIFKTNTPSPLTPNILTSPNASHTISSALHTISHTLFRNISSSHSIAASFPTICQLLFSYNDTSTNNITAYECFDYSRSDLTHSSSVCSKDQLKYMQANGSSFCGNLTQTNGQISAYPYICQNSSNLCSNPLTHANITCLYNATDNTLCSQHYHESSIFLTNSENQPIRVLSIGIPANLLSTKYNLLCSGYSIPSGKALVCYQSNRVITSSVAPQIGELSFETNDASYYMQNNNPFNAFNYMKFIGYEACYNPPYYSDCIFLKLISQNNQSFSLDCTSSPSNCLRVNISNCLFDSKNNTALCYISDQLPSTTTTTANPTTTTISPATTTTRIQTTTANPTTTTISPATTTTRIQTTTANPTTTTRIPATTTTTTTTAPVTVITLNDVMIWAGIIQSNNMQCQFLQTVNSPVKNDAYNCVQQNMPLFSLAQPCTASQLSYLQSNLACKTTNTSSNTILLYDSQNGLVSLIALAVSPNKFCTKNNINSNNILCYGPTESTNTAT